MKKPIVGAGIIVLVMAASAGLITGPNSGGNRAGGGTDSGGTVYNASDFGAVSYVPNQTIFYNTTTIYPTNLADSTAAIQNALNSISNKPPPRIIQFGPGVYRITNALSVPALTYLRGAGILHGIQASGPTQLATNAYTIIWNSDSSTNREGVYFSEVNRGRCGLQYIEICNATNPLAGSGLGDGAVANALDYLPGSAFGNRGVIIMATNVGAGGFSGGFEMIESSITGNKIGLDYGGYGNYFYRPQFICNDVGVLATNINTVQQLSLFIQPSVGVRKGGVGYILRGVSGWTILDTSDLFYRTFAVLIGSSLTMIGGQSESDGSTNNIGWSIFVNGGTGQTFYTNTWIYNNTAFFDAAGNAQGAYFENWLGDVANQARSPSTLNLIGVNFTGSRRALVREQVGGISLNCVGTSFVTTTNWNTRPTILLTGSGDTTAKIGFESSYATPTAMVETYFTTTRVFAYPVGEGSMFGPPKNQHDWMSLVSNDPSTNINLFENYGKLSLQTPYTAGLYHDYLRMMLATNRNADGTFAFGVSRLIASDPGPPYSTGRPNTNVLVNRLRLYNLVGNGTAPTVATNTGGGAGVTGGTVSLTGTAANPSNIAFDLTVNAGVTPAATAAICTVTFPDTDLTPGIPVLSPANAVTAALGGVTGVFATNTTTTMVLVSGATGLTGSTTYRWHVFIPR